MKSNVSTVLLFILLILGIAIILYPTVSDYYNSFHQSQAIASYSEAMMNVSAEDYTKEWNAATEYNDELRTLPSRFTMTDEQLAYYESLLNITGSGIMGYIEVPKIKVTLPIYHGTDDAVLQIAIGHIEGSSLPVGGVGTHMPYADVVVVNMAVGHGGLCVGRCDEHRKRKREGRRTGR